jgi:hypothetical protein
MHPDPNWRRITVVTAVLGKRLLDGDGAPKSGARRGEGDEEAVARVIDLLTTVLAEQRPKRPVVPVDETEPGRVTDRLDEIRRAADVAEQERSRDGLAAIAAKERSGTARRRDRPETLEDRVRGLQLQCGRVVLLDRQVRLRKDGPSASGLVRKVERVPAPDGLPER